jgi:hypothetical protein
MPGTATKERIIELVVSLPDTHTVSAVVHWPPRKTHGKVK